jgi:hypothetical protein
VALDKRREAYKLLNDQFGILVNFANYTREEAEKKLRSLTVAYPGDLPPAREFSQEFQQFQAFFSSLKLQKPENEGTATFIYKTLHSAGVNGSFPNVEIVYRIYLSIMATNCGGERSFSVLKRVKTAIRSTMCQERLDALGLLCIESHLLRELSFEDIISDFSIAKSRRHSV